MQNAADFGMFSAYSFLRFFTYTFVVVAEMDKLAVLIIHLFIENFSFQAPGEDSEVIL